VNDATPAEKLAALNERLKGTALLSLLNIKQKPAPDALLQRVTELRDVVFGLCAHLPEGDPVRATAIERLKSVEALVTDPLEWHILTRAQELRQDPGDAHVRSMIESAFYEEHVPRAVWQSAPPDGGHNEVRKSMRLPVLFEVDLDVGGGKRARCQTLNLSRDGVCLDVPADYSSSAVAMIMYLASTGQQINVVGDVVWREPGRVGVAFKIGVAEQNALDAALQAHFASLTRTVERWRAIAPKSGAAIACAAVVAYASTALPSVRREQLDKLKEAAQSDPTSKDLELALAKIAIEEKDYDTASRALRRIVVNDRADPRYRVLELTLQQRSGKSGRSLAALLRSSGAKAAAGVLAFLLVVVAGVAIFVNMQGPAHSVAVPRAGLPCVSLTIARANAMCVVDPAAYKRLDKKERMRLASQTVEPYRGNGVEYLTVTGQGGGLIELLDMSTPPG
jgi:hypothetical protein